MEKTFFFLGGLGIFFVIAAFCFRYFLVHFLVSVPEITGLVTINIVTGTLYSYEPGIHLRYPWEQVKEENYINLRIITPPEMVETCPSSDGPAVIVRWSFQYRPIAQHLPQYIAVDESTINKGLSNIGSAFLSNEIAGIPIIDVKSQQALLEANLKKTFSSAQILFLYGVEIVDVALADIDNEERFQRARATEQIAVRLRGVAEEIVKKSNGQISEKEAMNMALLMNKDITKDIQETEGEGGQALASLLMAMARGKGGNK